MKPKSKHATNAFSNLKKQYQVIMFKATEYYDKHDYVNAINEYKNAITLLAKTKESEQSNLDAKSLEKIAIKQSETSRDIAGVHLLLARQNSAEEETHYQSAVDYAQQAIDFLPGITPIDTRRYLDIKKDAYLTRAFAQYNLAIAILNSHSNDDLNYEQKFEKIHQASEALAVYDKFKSEHHQQAGKGSAGVTLNLPTRDERVVMDNTIIEAVALNYENMADDQSQEADNNQDDPIVQHIHLLDAESNYEKSLVEYHKIRTGVPSENEKAVARSLLYVLEKMMLHSEERTKQQQLARKMLGIVNQYFPNLAKLTQEERVDIDNYIFQANNYIKDSMQDDDKIVIKSRKRRVIVDDSDSEDGKEQVNTAKKAAIQANNVGLLVSNDNVVTAKNAQPTIAPIEADGKLSQQKPSQKIIKSSLKTTFFKANKTSLKVKFQQVVGQRLFRDISNDERVDWVLEREVKAPLKNHGEDPNYVTLSHRNKSKKKDRVLYSQEEAAGVNDFKATAKGVRKNSVAAQDNHQQLQVIENFKNIFMLPMFAGKNSDSYFKSGLMRCISRFHRKVFEDPTLLENYQIKSDLTKRSLLRLAYSMAGSAHALFMYKQSVDLSGKDQKGSRVFDESYKVCELMSKNYNDDMTFSLNIMKEYEVNHAKSLQENTIDEIIESYLLELRDTFENEGDINQFLAKLLVHLADECKSGVIMQTHCNSSFAPEESLSLIGHVLTNHAKTLASNTNNQAVNSTLSYTK